MKPDCKKQYTEEENASLNKLCDDTRIQKRKKSKAIYKQSRKKKKISEVRASIAIFLTNFLLHNTFLFLG